MKWRQDGDEGEFMDDERRSSRPPGRLELARGQQYVQLVSNLYFPVAVTEWQFIKTELSQPKMYSKVLLVASRTPDRPCKMFTGVYISELLSRA